MSDLFGGSDPAPPPVIPPPPVMPVPDDEAVRRARQKSVAMQRLRGGRASTILTDNDETLG